jgi:hypothetical protein
VLSALNNVGYIGATSGYRNMASLLFEVDGTVTDTSSAPGKITFRTTADGSIAHTERWVINNAGNLLAFADDTYDIGASGATRPQTLYLGTSAVVAGTTTISNGDIDTTAGLVIGGTSATSLAIGRSGVTTDFPSGSTVDFTGATVTGLSAGTTTLQDAYGDGNTISMTDANGDFDVSVGSGTPSISLDASGSSNFSVAGSSTLTLEAPTSGRVIINAGSSDLSAIDLNATGGSINMVAADGINMSSDKESDLTVTGATRVLTLAVTGGSSARVAINSNGTGTNAIDLNATAGGITFDALNTIAFNDTKVTGPRSVLSTATSINAAATGATTLYTVPAGKTAIIEKVIIRVTVATAANGDAVAGVGIAAGEDDIVSPVTLTGLTTLDDGFVLEPGIGKFRIADATEVVSLGIDTADTGGTVTWEADVIGYIF